MDLDQFADDTPDDTAPGGAKTCVVAAQTDTFDRCRKGFYPAPRSYNRTRVSFEYMAFYRTAPTSAVTHYAKVTDRVEQTRGKPGPMVEADWEELIDPFSSESEVVVFELSDLIPLNAPVDNDATGVRGAWFCDVDDLRSADTITDLANRADT